MTNIRNVLITGGSGFIGTNLIGMLMERRSRWELVNVDKLTYAANPITLSSPVVVIRRDINDREDIRNILKSMCIDTILNLAAESHVDNSILDPSVFVKTNVLGTQVLLDLARELKIPRFIQISTDEVYGSLGPTGLFSEESPIKPSSPYSASKAAADLLALSYHHTYGMDIRITRCSNNYGPYQFPEKLIPLMISKALVDEPLPVYGNGLQVRDWIHVEDHCKGILAVLEKGEAGQVYNLGSNNEKTNMEIVRTILKVLGRTDSLISHVKDRPGHDTRYAIDASKAKRLLGWEAQMGFESGLTSTINWYIDNYDWLDNRLPKKR